MAHNATIRLWGAAGGTASGGRWRRAGGVASGGRTAESRRRGEGGLHGRGAEGIEEGDDMWGPFVSEIEKKMWQG